MAKLKLIPIEFGGQTRNIQYGVNALCELEGVLGKSFFQIIDAVAGSVSVSDLRGLIWAGLLHETPNLTLGQVGEWMQAEPEGFTGLGKKIKAAIEQINIEN